MKYHHKDESHNLKSPEVITPPEIITPDDSPTLSIKRSKLLLEINDGKIVFTFIKVFC